MPPKKKEPTLTETIQQTLTLLQQLEEKHNIYIINQLGWNLGWHQGIYYTDITEHPDYDKQALNLAIKILEDILEAHPQEE